MKKERVKKIRDEAKRNLYDKGTFTIEMEI